MRQLKDLVDKDAAELFSRQKLVEDEWRKTFGHITRLVSASQKWTSALETISQACKELGSVEARLDHAEFSIRAIASVIGNLDRS